MSLEFVTMWRCDVCATTAPERTEGWADAIYTHGCPDHAVVVAAHRATVDSDTRGRGRSERTTWTLRCACGWHPAPPWSSYTAEPLERQHRAHVCTQAALANANVSRAGGGA